MFASTTRIVRVQAVRVANCSTVKMVGRAQRESRWWKIIGLRHRPSLSLSHVTTGTPHLKPRCLSSSIVRQLLIKFLCIFKQQPGMTHLSPWLLCYGRHYTSMPSPDQAVALARCHYKTCLALFSMCCNLILNLLSKIIASASLFVPLPHGISTSISVSVRNHTPGFVSMATHTPSRMRVHHGRPR